MEEGGGSTWRGEKAVWGERDGFDDTGMKYERNPGEHVTAAFWIEKRTHII